MLDLQYGTSTGRGSMSHVIVRTSYIEGIGKIEGLIFHGTKESCEDTLAKISRNIQNYTKPLKCYTIREVA